MDDAKKYRLMDLIDDIKGVDAMLKLHSTDTSAMMLEQYKYKKDKLVSYLIDELVNPEVRSAKSIFIIKKAIEKFYPDLTKEAEADIEHEDLNELEAVLT
jgi:ribosome maturation protein Sdo1